jgi:lipooligosaccharide transport system permease protein
MTSIYYRMPRPKYRAFYVLKRNFLVWRKLLGPALVLHFGEPLIYLLGLGIGLGQFVGDMGEVSYLAFLAAGIVASSALMTASMEGTYSVFTRMVPQQTYNAMLTTPIDTDDIVAGEFLWCATKATMSSIAILTVASLIGVVESITAVLAIPIAFVCGLCFAGPAIIMASCSPSYDFFNYYFTLLVTPMFVLCGVFYPTTILPETLQSMVQVLPLTHAIALIRPLVLGQEVTQAVLHLSVISAYTVVGYYVATVVARKRLFV